MVVTCTTHLGLILDLCQLLIGCIVLLPQVMLQAANQVTTWQQVSMQ
jgi:hypothetical protein